MPVVLPFGERDVREAVEMKIEHAVLDAGLDQVGGLPEKLLLVGHEGIEHADGELVSHDGAGAEPDHQHVLEAVDQVVGGLEADGEAALADRAADRFRIAVLPHGLAVGFAAEDLDALDGAGRLDEGGLLLGGRLDHLLLPLAQGAVEGKA